jgi:hypothetical protein
MQFWFHIFVPHNLIATRVRYVIHNDRVLRQISLESVDPHTCRRCRAGRGTVNVDDDRIIETEYDNNHIVDKFLGLPEIIYLFFMVPQKSCKSCNLTSLNCFKAYGR